MSDNFMSIYVDPCLFLRIYYPFRHFLIIIYVTVASEFSTTVSSVERNIRTVRDVMMRNGGHHLLVEMTGCPVWEDKTPYPKDLIAIFCEYLLNRYPLISAMQAT